MATATSEDTEITLGLGKMLALFFGLVALCAVFFGMGFSLGRNQAKPQAAELSPPTPVSTTSGARPSAVRPTGANSSDLTFYKAVENKGADSQLTAAQPAANPPEGSAPAADGKPAAADPVALPPVNGYYVQVAAVSKQEDAEALVDALKKKQYPAFAANTPPDALFHVQVGPYGDLKDAEIMRAKLVSDGYNPILKK
jgi:DedD protein